MAGLRTPVQDPEAQQDRHRPHMGHEEINEAGPAVALLVVLGGHEEIGGHCHHLPGDQERIGVVGDQHQRHTCEEHVVLESQERQGL
jgi:hypothetical protein